MGNCVHANMTFIFNNFSNKTKFVEKLIDISSFASETANKIGFRGTNGSEYLEKVQRLHEIVIHENKMGLQGGFLTIPSDVEVPNRWIRDNYGVSDIIVYDDGTHIRKPFINVNRMDVVISATFQWDIPHKWIHLICDTYDADCKINMYGNHGYDRSRILIKKNEKGFYWRLNNIT